MAKLPQTVVVELSERDRALLLEIATLLRNPKPIYVPSVPASPPYPIIPRIY